MQKPTRVCKCVRAQSRARARSLHLLRHLGITHLLNATDDLLLPEPSAGFQCAPPHLARRAAGPNLVHVQNRHAVALARHAVLQTVLGRWPPARTALQGLLPLCLLASLPGT